MPFIFRTTTQPTLAQISELEQIVIVDKTGPTVNLGVSAGAACIVGEFLKGPFVPTEVYSTADIINTFGGVSPLFSQSFMNDLDDTIGAGANKPVQDGSGAATSGWEGGGYLHLLGRKFRRLVIQRVDCDATTTDGGTTKGSLSVTVTIGAADITGGKTNRDLIVPAGTRFADSSPVSGATTVVATSQDTVIVNGTTTAGTVTITPTVFFVKGYSATIGPALIDTPIDTTVLGAAASTTVVSAVTHATTLFAPGAVGSTTLSKRIEDKYIGGSSFTGAIPKLAPNGLPTEDITVTFSARNSKLIRQALWNDAINSSGMARGRVACLDAYPGDYRSGTTVTYLTMFAAILGQASADTVTGENADRALYTAPYTQVYSSDLSMDVSIGPSGWRASLVNQLPEEVQTSIATSYLAAIDRFEPMFDANPFTRGNYVSAKANGIGLLIKDRVSGWMVQSAVTGANITSYPTRQFDNRRRFADFVQDTLASIAVKYQKQPGTNERKDAFLGEIDGFLLGLLSPTNPPQQRIDSYLLDGTSGNTPALEAVGVYTIIVKVRMLGDLNYIVYQTQIGPTVEITTTT